MDFYFKANGRLIKGPSDTLYQGSALASEIKFIAPVAPSAAVFCSFVLPNGYITYKYQMTLDTEHGLDGVVTENCTKYYVWKWTATEVLTAYSGTVRAQFFVEVERAVGAETVISRQGTFTASFTVQGGTLSQLPEEIPQDVWNSLIASYNSLVGTVTDQGSLISALDGRVDEVEGGLGTLDQQINGTGGIDDRLEAAEGDIDDLETAVGG